MSEVNENGAMPVAEQDLQVANLQGTGNSNQITKSDLSKYDFVVMIDKSGSMSRPDCPGGKTRWAHAQEETEAMARKCAEFDDDGIDVVVFSDTSRTYTGTTPDKVLQIFEENEPMGGTNTAAALRGVLDDYFVRKAAGGHKPLIVVCITDGEPDSQSALSQVIVNATNNIDNETEIGIVFIQVGADSGARAFLKSLDDDLTSHGAKYDIVDTFNDEEMANTTATAILLGAVND